MARSIVKQVLNDVLAGDVGDYDGPPEHIIEAARGFSGMLKDMDKDVRELLQSSIDHVNAQDTDDKRAAQLMLEFHGMTRMMLKELTRALNDNMDDMSMQAQMELTSIAVGILAITDTADQMTEEYAEKVNGEW